MHSLIYSLACIVLPVLWGVIVYLASDAIGKKVGHAESSREGHDQNRSAGTGLPLDYHI